MAVSAQNSLEPPVLLVLLADGGLHSGESLAQALGVSRAAVWKAVARLRAQGIGVEALARRGYRLPMPVELLNAATIRAAVHAARQPLLHRLSVEFDLDSTNTRLLAAPPPPDGRAQVLVAELQQAGRGRRGRQWIAPFGGSIALSLGWSFTDAARADSAMSLGVGVAVVRALRRCGAAGITLKWPNDLWFNDRKIGGVLLEMRGEAGGPGYVVIGIGLNVALTAAARAVIDAAGTSAGGVRVAAADDAGTAPLSRNLLAGTLIDELLRMLPEFEREGFDALRPAWAELDALRDRPVTVLIGGAAVSGIARGVDERGAFLLETADGTRKFVSGEVTLRLTEGAI